MPMLSSSSFVFVVDRTLNSEPYFLHAASVHASLASLVYSVGSGLEGSRILVNSYGSGLAASLFCIQARPVTGRFSLASIAHKVRRST